jgi:predicted porin
MQKTVLALAMALAMGSAAAQSNVTVYGIADAGLALERGGSAGTITKVSSGMEAGARLGFKGSEDLGSGLSAVFLFENGFAFDTGAAGQGGLLFGRQAYVGLASKTAGTVLLGRQYTPEYQTLGFADPFALGLAGDAKNLGAVSGNSSGRMDNSIKYSSPDLQGAMVELAYAPGEVGTSASAGRQYGFALMYRVGPLALRLGQHTRNNDTATVKNAENARNVLLGAVLDVSWGKANFAYGTAKGTNSSPLRNSANPYGASVAPVASKDSKYVMIGTSIVLGAGTLLASYTRKDDAGKLNQDARLLAVGYKYALSKRSDLYAAYGHITNQHGAGYTVGSSIETGSGNSGMNLGMRHNF